MGISSTNNINDYKNFFSFKKTWAFGKLINSPESMIFMATGNQYGKCLSYQSLISTTGGEKTVGELFEHGEPFTVYAWDGKKKIVTQAMEPFKKPKKEPCVRIELEDRQWFEAALGHRVLTSHGWMTISSILSWHQQESSLSLQASNLEPCRLVHAEDGLRCVRKEQDCPDDCSTDYCLCGGQPLSCANTDQFSAPLQADALQHNCSLSGKDGVASIYKHTHSPLHGLLSNLGAVRRYVGRFFEFLIHVTCNAFQSMTHGHPSFLQPSTAGVSFLRSNTEDRQYQYQSCSKTYNPPKLVNGNRIVSYKFIGCQDVYDFEVPIYHNYMAAGVVHHNTAGAAYQYVMRILGIHPVPKKNIVYFECIERQKMKDDHDNYLGAKEEFLKKHESVDSATFTYLNKPEKCPECGGEIIQHQRGTRTFRFASQTLPGQTSDLNTHGMSAEVKNTQYPAFKKWLPAHLIKKDITFRAPAMIVKDPFGGEDIVIDFVSYNQSIQSTAGTQRCSIWYDEEPDPDFREEQIPRLLAEDGDEILTLTPANHICFDEKTKVLSTKGWIGYNEIVEGDKLLTLNTETRNLEIEDVDLIYRNEIDEELVSLKCQGFDALVTENHRWPILTKANKLHMKETKDLKGHHKIFRAIKNDIEGQPIYEDWFVELAGWFLTDGSIVPDGHKIWICQSLTANSRKCEKIRKIVSNCNDFYETSNKYHIGEPCEGVVCIWYIGGDEAKKLRELFQTRELTEKFLFDLTKKQQQLLYDSLIDGDGCRTKDGDKLRGTKNTIDAFLALCFLLGKRSTRAQETTKTGTIVYKAYVQKENGRYKPFTHVASLKQEKVPYKGIIWCPHTKNNTLVAKRNGTVYITGNTWTYDGIFEQASVYYRTKAICDFLKTDSYTPKRIERTGRNTSICVIQAATDDNPVLNIDVIDAMFEKVDDPDLLAIRRYGVFKQVSGRIFKDFEYPIHVISSDKYLSEGIPHSWTHARGIDYHMQTPWACGCISLSDTNEAFIWGEFNPSPEKYTTNEIAEYFSQISKDYKFAINLIDPLAKAAKKNNINIVDDLNAKFRELKRDGIGTGGYWTSWDTKGEKGRDEIKKRLRNSKIVGKPFNNVSIKDGRKEYLPTLWILDTCNLSAKSMRQWRWEQYTEPKLRQTKGEKNKPEQRWSHFNMVWEACFKNPLFKARSGSFKREERAPQYFKAR